MYVDLPEIQRCCCCVPARYGLIIWLYIKLILSLLTIFPVATFLMYINQYLGSDGFVCVVTFITLALVVDIIIDIVALVGGHMKKVKLLNLYYKYSIVSIVLFLVIYITVLIFNIVFAATFTDVFNSIVIRIIIWYIMVGFGSISIQIYMLLLLRSKVRKMNNNCQFRFENHAANCEATCVMDVDFNIRNCPHDPYTSKTEDIESKKNEETNNDKKFENNNVLVHMDIEKLHEDDMVLDDVRDTSNDI